MADSAASPRRCRRTTRYDLAPKTWELHPRGCGRAPWSFTMPAGADQVRRGAAEDRLPRRRPLAPAGRPGRHPGRALVLPTPACSAFRSSPRCWSGWLAGYGIEVHKNSELVEVDPHGRRRCRRRQRRRAARTTITYDLHARRARRRSPRTGSRRSPLADPANPAGYVEIDKHTMQHTRYPNVFALGDAGSSPNCKTGAAIRKQAPVVVRQPHVRDGRRQPPTASYDGYASCPLTTARDKMLLAEFDYTMKPHPSFPTCSSTRRRSARTCGSLKRYGLPVPVLEPHAPRPRLTRGPAPGARVTTVAPGPGEVGERRTTGSSGPRVQFFTCPSPNRRRRQDTIGSRSAPLAEEAPCTLCRPGPTRARSSTRTSAAAAATRWTWGRPGGRPGPSTPGTCPGCATPASCPSAATTASSGCAGRSTCWPCSARSARSTPCSRAGGRLATARTASGWLDSRVGAPLAA